MNKLQELYQKEIVPSLVKDLESGEYYAMPTNHKSCCEYRCG